MFRRIAPLAIILSLLCAYVPAPALALSTQAEIEMGNQYDEQIVQSNVIETDPLLNAYVRGIANKLWAQTARKDIPYNIKIIKAGDINSFATLGGYVYLYEGMVDFVQSDDELAAIIGHETGHIERRHVVTMQAKAQAMSLLFAIASIFSPLIYNFGNVVEAGLMAKMSRADEIQADRTGLQLMSRAGFDPEANVTMMEHMTTLEDAHESAVDRYLEDHPDAKARVGMLMGYPELDPTKVTNDELLARASSDEERARYNTAMLELTQYLQKDPNNPIALLKLSQAQLAIGETSKSQQTLAEAEQNGTPQTRADAQQHMLALRQLESQRVSLTTPNLDKLRDALSQAQDEQNQAAAQIAVRRDEGKDELKTVQDRVTAIGYEIPDLSNIQINPGSHLDAMTRNLASMSRAIDSALEDAGNAIDGPGSLEKGKETGLLKVSADTLHDMQAPLADNPVPSDSLAIFPSYPEMIDEMNHTNADMIRSVDAGRASLVMLDEGLGDVDIFLRQLGRARLGFNNDITPGDANTLDTQVKAANDQLNRAAVAAAQAAQLYNMARSRQLSIQLTLLGLGTSPQRYQTLQYALNQRFSSTGIDYDSMVKENLTPGDVTVATILAADINSTPQAVIASAKSDGRTMVDEANARGMHAWPLEIFLGLMYLDYTDDPTKEMHT
jgi:Zn-dependent protease with chaperone function